MTPFARAALLLLLAAALPADGPMLDAPVHTVAASPEPGRIFLYESALAKLRAADSSSPSSTPSKTPMQSFRTASG
ncbi:MAG: hypothetical protein ACK5AZ_21395 [Bryobacteraceae bacterium]